MKMKELEKPVLDLSWEHTQHKTMNLTVMARVCSSCYKIQQTKKKMERGQGYNLLPTEYGRYD